ncbi:hypothetical protein [Candidatus Tisiphia endosymbiont of Mystacides longicornis]|uniref:hypothetical protein n=1 Tax=Candidatus Tisiphia endosymbiont of Mystacides longicornis TaxID=3139330 RepID=UPI003CCAC022
MAKFTDESHKKQIDSTKLGRLINELGLYDMNIKNDDTDDNAYHMKGTTLLELARLTGDKTYLDKALECFNKAISLTNNQNPLYLASRSKLYADMGVSDLAAEDIRQINKLPKEEGIIGKHVQNIVSDISKLDAIQASIDSLEVSSSYARQISIKQLELEKTGEVFQQKMVELKQYADDIRETKIKCIQEMKNIKINFINLTSGFDILNAETKVAGNLLDSKYGTIKTSIDRIKASMQSTEQTSTKLKQCMDKMNALTDACTMQIENIKDQIEKTKAEISSSMGSKTKLENNNERIKQLEKDQDLNKKEVIELQKMIDEVRNTTVKYMGQIKATEMQLKNTQVAFDKATAKSTTNDKSKVSEQITDVDTTSIKKVTDEQHDSYSTDETFEPSLLGAEGHIN